jgi:hypothetical protein
MTTNEREQKNRRLLYAARLDAALVGLDTTFRLGGSRIARRLARVLDEHITTNEIAFFLEGLEEARESDQEAK